MSSLLGSKGQSKVGKSGVPITGRCSHHPRMTFLVLVFKYILWCFSNIPGLLPPQSLFIGCSFCLECSSFRFPHFLQVLVKCYLLKEVYPDYMLKLLSTLSPQHSPPHFILTFLFSFPPKHQPHSIIPYKLLIYYMV